MLGRTLGHFQIIEKLGAGGMGEVFSARDLQLNRLVAIKVLPPVTTDDPVRRLRFIQEARAASALNHPNIVTIHEISRSEDLDFIAMEMVPGHTLARILRDHPPAMRDVIAYASQVAGALHAAHAAHIVHRDLKPGNVMVTPDGLVKVLDFGLAKLTAFEPVSAGGDTETIGPLTGAGIAVGTPAYMSPEQSEGKPVDARSDIFSFGALLYEMVTGRPAFQGNSHVATLAAVLRDVPPAASTINPQAPPELVQIIARCLEKRPEDRYQTMREVCALLEDLKTGSQSGRVSLPPQAGSRRPVRPGSKYVAIAAAALTAASALLWISFGRHTAAPAREYTLTRLTLDGGLGVAPAISADGRLLAYASDHGEGNLDIWVRQISGGDALRLTRDSADESEPSFSPDGARIAFSSLRSGGGGIYTISSLGGDLRFVAADGRRPRFSPDGKSIVYWVRDRLTGWGKVYVVPAAGGTPRQIVPEFPDAKWPVWSPDGAVLLFDGSPGNGSHGDWWTAPFAGGASPAKTGARDIFQSNGMKARPEPGDWRGNAVIFALHKGDTTNIWRLPVSPWNLRADGNPQRLTAGSSTDSAPTVSPAGVVVFATGAQSVDLWVRPVDSTGEKFTGPLERLPSGGAPSHENPTVSKDGRICAFAATRADTRELWIRDMNTGRESRLTNFAEAEPPIGGKPVGASVPVISPEGNRVAFKKTAGPAVSLWAIPATGGAAAQLTDVCGSPIEWLPGGRFLVFRSCDRLQKLLFLDTSTKSLVTLIDSPKWSVRSAAISPDAHTLAIGAVSKQPHSVIFLAPWSGGGAIPEGKWTAVTAESEDAQRPVWAPAGGMLYFSIGDAAGVYGQRVDRAGRPAAPRIKVQELGSRYQFDGHDGIAAAPGRLILSLRETLSEIWMGRPEN